MTGAPDWDSILPGREDKLYTLIVLNKPAACPPVRRFDYDALCARFRKVLHLRRGFYDRYSHFGFLFTETPAHDRAELDAIVRDDLLATSSPKTMRRRPRPDKQTKEALMKKIGIIRCMQTEDICPGTTDFSFAAQGKGAFEELGPCEVIGLRLLRRLVPASGPWPAPGCWWIAAPKPVALASCICKGNPPASPAPTTRP